MVEKRPDYLPVLGEASEKDLVKWILVMKKHGLPVGREMIIQKASEIDRYMFGFTRSLGSVVRGYCKQFMSRHCELTLRTSQIIKRARNKASLEVLWSFF